MSTGGPRTQSSGVLAMSQGDSPPSRTIETAVDQVRALLPTIPVGLIGSLLPAVVMAWLFHNQVSRMALATWLVSMALAHMGRLLVWFAARHDPDFGPHARRWLGWLRLTALALGLSWAILPAAIAPSSPFDELLVTALVIAVTGTGMAQQSADLPSALGFILPPAIPTAIRIVGSPDLLLQSVGFLVVLYFIYLVLAARRLHASFQELSRLHTRATTQSLHDVLTGLPNRFALDLRLQEAVIRAARNETEVAVAYVDLDDFKQVNDQFGHEAGDTLLRAVADRWRVALRESEMIARLGGDEFVLVIEGLDPAQLMVQLNAIFKRIEGAIAAPFPIAPETSVQVGMTMGVARYPVDGTDPDELVRRADAAMYQLKQRKGVRETWWQLGTNEMSAESRSPGHDPYGIEAGLILGEYGNLIESINRAFIESFYRDLDSDPAASALLKGLDQRQFEALKQRQQAYLRYLVAPSTSLQALVARARHVGTVHYLGGVSGSMIARSSVRYRALLGEHLAAARLLQARRHEVLAVIDSRLQDELQAQFTAGEETGRLYLGVLTRPRPHPNILWPDAVQDELSVLAALPGIVVVALRRLNRDGQLVVEHSACSPGSSVPETFFDTSAAPHLDPGSVTGQSTTSVAWRTQSIERVDSWSSDPRVAPWREEGMGAGIHSHVSIPFAGTDAHVAGVLTIYGAQSGQFASLWMQQWSASVQHRMESVWALCGARPSGSALPEPKALRYKEQLFSGGLEMHVQPILNLRTGGIDSVEALARLRMPDGEVVSPAIFLPSLGDIELDRVFRAGLDQALDALQVWDRRGLRLGMSVNLSPSTLFDPECVAWVRESLDRHAIAPSRLNLELLETQAEGLEAQRDAIERLRNVGIRVSMDDLGAGYSSIERLSLFRFDSIKIEQTLVRRIYVDPAEAVTLVGTLILLGADLGRSIVVEGVEDPSMLEVAAVLGAKYAQGYSIAAPMPVDRFPDWLGQFAAPFKSGDEHLHTYAGALAFHWRYIHFNHNHHPAQASTCPLGWFLRQKGFAGTEIDRAHDCVHSGTREVAEASAQLMDWLAGQVKASRPS